MKIALIGYGKMGKAIEEIALQSGHKIALKISSANIDELNKQNLQSADVAIEFTTPESALSNVRICIEAGIPVVCGSTGWLQNLEEIKKLCAEKNGTLLYASNFSIGVNLFFELNIYLSKLMEDYKEYDVMLEEIHHTQKKDAPSGTAITLAEQVVANIQRKKQWVNVVDDCAHKSEQVVSDNTNNGGDNVVGDNTNNGDKGVEIFGSNTNNGDSNNLKIISKRIDPAPGTHKVKYTSAIDDIEIIHTAHNRKGFAAGALKAAEFVIGRKGIFTMKDVLGL